MNKEWSELNKTMQAQIKKKDTFESGKGTLFDLRNRLMQTMVSLRDELSREDFDAIPFINADGFHSKTIAYSIWHIFRIEDIVAHTLINEDEQVFFADNYQERINSSIITTGNELVKQQIADFSGQLNLQELYSYIFAVKDSTEKIIKSLSYDKLIQKISGERKESNRKGEQPNHSCSLSTTSLALSTGFPAGQLGFENSGGWGDLSRVESSGQQGLSVFTKCGMAT